MMATKRPFGQDVSGGGFELPSVLSNLLAADPSLQAELASARRRYVEAFTGNAAQRAASIAGGSVASRARGGAASDAGSDAASYISERWGAVMAGSTPAPGSMARSSAAASGSAAHRAVTSARGAASAAQWEVDGHRPFGRPTPERPMGLMRRGRGLCGPATHGLPGFLPGPGGTPASSEDGSLSARTLSRGRGQAERNAGSMVLTSAREAAREAGWHDAGRRLLELRAAHGSRGLPAPDVETTGSALAYRRYAGKHPFNVVPPFSSCEWRTGIPQRRPGD